METLFITSLLIAGWAFFAVEVFLIPGISLAGLLSAASLLYAVYYTFCQAGTEAGFLTLAVAAIGIAAITAWFMRSKTVDRLSLKKTLDYRPDPLAGTELKVGACGMSVTRLTLIGNADFGGYLIEVKSADGFIDEKTPIEVVGIRDGQVLVKKRSL